MRPTVKLFAAVDAAKEIRFIDDVPAGAACACFCAACGSPLIARKGTIKAHHFAHEASQERPECLVGALNLIRRVAAELLRTEGMPPLPAYRRQVSRRLLSGMATELVQWDAQPVRIEWLEGGSQGDPVARLLLDNEVQADLLITIAEDPPSLSHVESSEGAIAFYTALPDYEILCSHTAVLEYLRHTGRFVWIHQPDVYGLIADASKRLRARYEAEEAQAEERARRDREQFERRHAELLAVASPPAPAAAAPTPPWATAKKRNGSYFGYRFADETVWVYFELEGGGYGLRALGASGEWQQQVPPGWGQYEPELDLVVCRNAPLLASASPVATRISSQLSDVLQLLEDNWDKGGFFRNS